MAVIRQLFISFLTVYKCDLIEFLSECAPLIIKVVCNIKVLVM